MAHAGRTPPLKARKLLTYINDGEMSISSTMSMGSKSRLEKLPLELLKMIMEFCIDPEDFRSIQRLLKKRTTCRLFDDEIVNAIVKFHDQPATTRIWDRSGAPFLRAALLENSIQANPKSPVLILALINKVVDQITQTQGDLSEENRRKWLKAACECVAHSKAINVNASLNVLLDLSHDGQAKLHENVRTSVWAVAAWDDNLEILTMANDGAFGVAPVHRLDSPRHMGSAQWAATYRDNLNAIMFLQKQGFDFGASARNNPLKAAFETNSFAALQMVLSGMRKEGDFDIGNLGSDIAKAGRLDWAKLLWDANFRRQTESTATATAALTTLCREGTSNHNDMARLLIKAGAKVNQASGTVHINTPLTLAIQHGPASLVRSLVENGARIRAGKYELGAGSIHTIDPLSIAIELRNAEAVEILLERKPWDKLTRHNALLAAVVAGVAETLPNGSVRYPGDADILELLLENFHPEGSKLSAQMGRGAVKRARADGKAQMLTMLLDHRCGDQNGP
ncbi:hypothetical protein IWZ00DRAFT_561978 [Phyllosticta capitalensis]